MNRALFLGTGAAAAFFPYGHAIALDSLDAKVARIARETSGKIGIFARTMDDGPPLVQYHALGSFPTASIIKVLVMVTAFVMEERQPGTLDHALTFSLSGDLIGGSDFMSEQADGATFTVRQLLDPMIRVSDNTAANMLIEFFGVDTINDVGGQADLQNTHLARKFIDTAAIVRVQNNVSTPADQGHLLYLIEKGAREDVATIVSAASCREMIAIMLGQSDRDKIPAGLPPDVPVANKTGEITGTRNDVAIVEPYGDSPFVLAIMTKEISDYDAAEAVIRSVARAVYRATLNTLA